MSDEKKTILDDLKKIEETKKKRVLAKILKTIKDDAKEVLITKYTYGLYMEELGIDKKEAKSIIDWINTLVEITPEDEKELKELVRSEIRDAGKQVEKKIEEAPYQNMFANTLTCDSLSGDSFIGAAIGGSTTTAGTAWKNDITCSNGEFEVK